MIDLKHVFNQENITENEKRRLLTISYEKFENAINKAQQKGITFDMYAFEKDLMKSDIKLYNFINENTANFKVVSFTDKLVKHLRDFESVHSIFNSITYDVDLNLIFYQMENRDYKKFIENMEKHIPKQIDEINTYRNNQLLEKHFLFLDEALRISNDEKNEAYKYLYLVISTSIINAIYVITSNPEFIENERDRSISMRNKQISMEMRTEDIRNSKNLGLNEQFRLFYEFLHILTL